MNVLPATLEKNRSRCGAALAVLIAGFGAAHADTPLPTAEPVPTATPPVAPSSLSPTPTQPPLTPAAPRRVPASASASPADVESASSPAQSAADDHQLAARRADREQAKSRAANLQEKEEARRTLAEQQWRERRVRREAELRARGGALRLSAEAIAHQIETEDAKFWQDEFAQRERAEDEIAAAAEDYDDSTERSSGQFGATVLWGAGGWTTGQSAAGSQLVGIAATARHGFWFEAPANGYASGIEVRGDFVFFNTLVPVFLAQHLSASPELRYFYGRFGFGAAVEWNRLNTLLAGGTSSADIFAGGPTVAFALIDNPRWRAVFGARWMPLGSNHWGRVAVDADLAWRAFSVQLRFGTQEDRTRAPLVRNGWFATVGVGGRLRW